MCVCVQTYPAKENKGPLICRHPMRVTNSRASSARNHGHCMPHLGTTPKLDVDVVAEVAVVVVVVVAVLRILVVVLAVNSCLSVD